MLLKVQSFPALVSTAVLVLLATALSPGPIQAQRERETAADAETLRQGFQAQVEGDYGLAESLFRQLSTKGSTEALFALARQQREGLSKAQDSRETFELFHRAAARGHVLAMHEVGLAYLEGRGVEADRELAWDWLFQAAQQHGPSAWQLFALAETDEEARPWLQRAAVMGVQDAMEELAQAYETGRYGLPAHAELSAHWRAELEKASLDVTQ